MESQRIQKRSTHINTHLCAHGQRLKKTMWTRTAHIHMANSFIAYTLSKQANTHTHTHSLPCSLCFVSVICCCAIKTQMMAIPNGRNWKTFGIHMSIVMFALFSQYSQQFWIFIYAIFEFVQHTFFRPNNRITDTEERERINIFMFVS